MNEHEGKGGSYLRQKDGSLKLVSRTEPSKAVMAKKPKAVGAKAPAAKKENTDG